MRLYHNGVNQLHYISWFTLIINSWNQVVCLLILLKIIYFNFFLTASSHCFIRTYLSFIQLAYHLIICMFSLIALAIYSILVFFLCLSQFCMNDLCWQGETKINVLLLLLLLYIGNDPNHELTIIKSIRRRWFVHIKILWGLGFYIMPGTQQTRNVHPMLFRWWLTVFEVVPTSKQCWVYFWILLCKGSPCDHSNRHETIIQCWFNAGSPSATLTWH